jgi:hypothetical protein
VKSYTKCIGIGKPKKSKRPKRNKLGRKGGRQKKAAMSKVASRYKGGFKK